MELADATLADLAVRSPGASRVFKRYGLDYCCRGQRPLAEACRSRNIDPAAVVADVEREARAAPPSPRPESLSSTDLVDHIVQRYHEPLRDELPLLVDMARTIERAHGHRGDCPHGLAEHVDRMRRELVDHMAQEEGVLFPLLATGQAPPGTIGLMRHDHDDQGRSLARLRALTGNFVAPAAACATWRALYERLARLESDLIDHIHLENNVLFERR